MPFGYLDASRVITKVLRVPVHSWRLEGIPVYVHIDDGLGVANSKEEAEEAVKVVKKDLKELGLITSEAKCEWKPKQKITWCGFEWDTDQFRVRVTDKKLNRIKTAVNDLLKKKKATAKELAAITGLIISCAPALGRMARFSTRFFSQSGYRRLLTLTVGAVLVNCQSKC